MHGDRVGVVEMGAVDRHAGQGDGAAVAGDGDLVAGASSVLLDPSGPRDGRPDRRWNVIPNADVEFES